MGADSVRQRFHAFLVGGRSDRRLHFGNTPFLHDPDRLSLVAISATQWSKTDGTCLVAACRRFCIIPNTWLLLHVEKVSQLILNTFEW